MTSDGKGSATINDVARLAGVSKRTISRVINNSPNVNRKTREKVEEIIAQLGYAPSKQAKGLASSRSYLLGLVYDEPNATVIHSVQKGILSACATHGYEMVVHPIDYQCDALISDVLNFVSRSNLDGLIIMPPISGNDDLAKALRDANIEYVRLAAREVDISERIIVSDDRSAMKQVADLFHQLGRKEIGVIVGPPHRVASRERYEGFVDALSKHGMQINSDYISVGDFSYESGLHCAEQLLKGDSHPDAVFASNDQMALAVIHTAEDLGIRVPEDLVVVGYDDDPVSSRLRPSLTTLKRLNADMARAAALKLIAATTNNPQLLDEIPTRFTPQLICRKSTGHGD